MSFENDSTPDEIGARVGLLLRERDHGQLSPRTLNLRDVYSGARHRRRRTARACIGVVCVAMVGVAGALLAAREAEPPPAQNPIVTRPPALPAYAVLRSATGGGEALAPVSMQADRGRGPYGAPIPAVDVWRRSATVTLVVRTVDNTAAADSTDVTTATTQVPESDPGTPWSRFDGAVPTTVRGVPAAVKQLAPDQFAVWVTQGSPDRYTVVIGRGMTHAETLAEVEALVDVGGVLEPPAGYTAIERAPALPASTAVGASATIGYDFDQGPWVGTYEWSAGRASIETASTFDVGRVETIGDRTVMVFEQFGRTTVSWWDVAGVEVSVTSLAADADVAELVGSVRMATEGEWQEASARLSRAITEQMSEVGRATVDGVTVVRRSGAGDVRALCLIVGQDAELCASQNTAGETPEGMTAKVEVDGHWIIYGYRAKAPDEVVDIGQMTFGPSAQDCCGITWVEHDDAYWYLVRVPDDVDLVDTNLGTIVGGMVGTMARPLVPSQT